MSEHFRPHSILTGEHCTHFCHCKNGDRLIFLKGRKFILPQDLLLLHIINSHVPVRSRQGHRLAASCLAPYLQKASRLFAGHSHYQVKPIHSLPVSSGSCYYRVSLSLQQELSVHSTVYSVYMRNVIILLPVRYMDCRTLSHHLHSCNKRRMANLKAGLFFQIIQHSVNKQNVQETPWGGSNLYFLPPQGKLKLATSLSSPTTSLPMPAHLHYNKNVIDFVSCDKCSLERTLFLRSALILRYYVV